MEHYIGLDAHSATCTFVSLEKNGKIQEKCRVATSESNLFREFVRMVKKREKDRQAKISHNESKKLQICSNLMFPIQHSSQNTNLSDYWEKVVHLFNC